ncbi:MAG: N-acetyltransferase [Parcubacteria group bacterium]|nr:N-acetyltransferase [Parcubacteria group bacterium]
MKVSTRNECKGDFKRVEEITREAFWNLYVPGCDEHYLTHILRDHPDFISDLDFVAAYEDKVIGNIMYTKSYIIDESDNRINTITFGPVCVLPEYQKQGVGSALIQHSKKIASENGYQAIIVEGHPHNYCRHGFKSSKDYRISNSEGKYPYSLLVLELKKGMLRDKNWKYYSSDVYDIDKKAADEFDKKFDPKKKEYKYTQEEFSIASRAYII